MNPVMYAIIFAVMVVLILIVGLMLQRVIKGPTILDRMNGVGVIGADVILLIVLFGYVDGRPDMYVDIALSYAILGFVGFVVVAKYLGRKKQ